MLEQVLELVLEQVLELEPEQALEQVQVLVPHRRLPDRQPMSLT